MHPYDKIVTRDCNAFPVEDFLDYPRAIAVDWREEEPRILRSFLAATGLSSDEARLEMDDKSGYYDLVRRVSRYAVPWGEGQSAQHSMLLALQKAFDNSHSLRYLNHSALGDTGRFIVETRETWSELERNNPEVRWFFTPVERLPDTFHSSPEELSEVGERYAARPNLAD